MIGPCAKKHVVCIINNEAAGRMFHGTNECANPQTTCPRLPGEGYEKCKSICQQEGHAETQALKAAGDYANGAYAIVHGQCWICRDCGKAMKKAGIQYMELVL